MIYVVVIEKAITEEVNFTKRNTLVTEMKPFNQPDSADRVLDYVTQIGRKEGDPRTLRRIFSVDEEAHVTDYAVVFDGKLMLIETRRAYLDDER